MSDACYVKRFVCLLMIYNFQGIKNVWYTAYFILVLNLNIIFI